MTRPISAPTRLAAMLLAALVPLAGCSSADPTPANTPSGRPTATSSPTGASADCAAVGDRLLDSVQRYVDSYGVPLAQGTTGSSPAPAGGDDTDLRTSLATAQRELQQAGCDLDQFRSDFKNGLQRVTARGPLAKAVLLRLSASMTGTLGSTPTTVTVRPDQDLAVALADLAPGSTAVLTAGRYRLRDPLVLLSGITLRGAGRARTFVSSAAADAAVLVLTDGRVELRQLTVRHTGRRPASVVVGGPTSSVVLTGARISGARPGPGGQAGSGVAMTSGRTPRPGGGTTLEVTGSDISGNGAAGILLTGRHRASIRSARFAGNGQCGICFAGSSSGAVRRSAFIDNAVGVAVFDRAAPLVAGSRFTDGQVALQASAKAAPVVRDVRIAGASRAGMIFSDRSSGRVDGASCTGTPYGIVVSARAYPYLGTNGCAVALGN